MSRSITFPLSLLPSLVSGLALNLSINGADRIAGLCKHGGRQAVQSQRVGGRL